MAQILKGTVTQVLDGGKKAILRPLGGGNSVTPELPVQSITITRPAFTSHQNEYNTGQHPELEWVEYHPKLKVGDSAVFALFEDGTGLIIDKI